MEEIKCSIEDLTQKFGTNLKTGLTEKQVQERLAKDGYNTIKKKIGRSFLNMFFAQFHDPLVYLLLIAGFIIFLAGDRFDAVIIAGILLLNASIGAFQEGRIALIVDKLRRFKKSYAVVLRDGVRHLIEEKFLVVGDIIVLQEGERIPADARIIESYAFSVDEALLSGESQAVRKGVQENDTIFAGSHVLSGYAQALVTVTGGATRLGAIAQTIETVSPDMPLQKDLNKLLQFILWVIVGICFVLLVAGIVSGIPFGRLLAALMALFICVVPQGLPIIMTLALVSGAYRMAQKKVLAKQLQAVEALGRADTIIMDKTGTLTRNELMVTSVATDKDIFIASGVGYFSDGHVMHNGKKIGAETASQEIKFMATAALLLNRSELTQEEKKKTFTVKGSPSEAAMALFAQKLGLNPAVVHQEYKMLYEIPFTSDLQYHAGFFEHNGKGIVFEIGSPEALMKRSKTVSEEHKKKLQQLFAEGNRVIAVSYKEFTLRANNDYDKDFFTSCCSSDFILLGFFSMTDTLRSEAEAIVKQIQEGGVTIFMATGDKAETALHLAQMAGIATQDTSVVTGKEIDNFSEDELQQAIKNTTVFARLSPENKSTLVTALAGQGRVTAMVGDGVNDAPAMAAAHLGIAMGNTASDLAKETADIILLDDSFSSIVAGIEQGRHIFTSFKRVTLYFFTTNFSEVMVMLGAFILRLPLPFLASQILWLNLITDGFLDSALAMEPREKGLLNKKWLQSKQNLITTEIVLRIIYQSSVVAFSCITIFYMHQKDLVLARTMTLVAITICQWVMALNCRSLHKSIIQIGFFSNRWLLFALLLIPLLLLGVLYTPWGNLIFKTVPLSWQQWQPLLLLGFGVLGLEEGRKYYIRRFFCSN